MAIQTSNIQLNVNDKIANAYLASPEIVDLEFWSCMLGGD